jgi:hypothetical protein
MACFDQNNVDWKSHPFATKHIVFYCRLKNALPGRVAGFGNLSFFDGSSGLCLYAVTLRAAKLIIRSGNAMTTWLKNHFSNPKRAMTTILIASLSLGIICGLALVRWFSH